MKIINTLLSSILISGAVLGDSSTQVQANQSKSWSVSRGGSENNESPATVMEVHPTDGVEKVENPIVDTSSESSSVFESAVVDEVSLVFAPSKDGDGSESDPDGIPTRFILMQKGNREKAKAAFSATVSWREENGVNSILERPHAKFDQCKRIFPVYIPGRDVSNNVIFIQRVGMIDLDLGRKNGVTGDDLLMHYVYMVEYCWNILEPSPNGVMTSVLDLKNVRMQTFRQAEIRDFLKKFVKTMSDHYPQRSHKTLIINAPSWVNMAYSLVKPLLRESTKQKITLLNGGSKQDKALIEILGKDSVPRDLLNDPDKFLDTNDDKVDGNASEIEVEMRQFVSSSQRYRKKPVSISKYSNLIFSPLLQNSVKNN